MKQLLTLLLCAFCLASCEKQQSAPVEKQPAEVGFADKEVEMLNDGKAATYKGKPYTGLIRNKH
ncbi:MAG: hypothetical protein NTY98_14760 [Verrucomicrobia bacterium]|nr:hypothetical protein [Verrucomicrobiota bacterium]